MPEGEEDLQLRVLRAGMAPGDSPDVFRVLLDTTRGQINGLIHPVEGGTGAVVCVGGAMGGLNGPADSLYDRLATLLAADGVTVLRLDYRLPNNFEECVLDTLAGCSFLKGIGAVSIVLMGHSFGAAVVIKAGELFRDVAGVVSLSTQLYGTRQVEELRRPLLLVHGTADTILSHEASEDIFRRALDPKEIVLYADTGHSLLPARAELDELLAAWIPARLAGEPMETSRHDVIPESAGDS